MNPMLSLRVRALTLAVAFAAAGSVRGQQVIYVNAAAAPGGDGTSWATAFTNPQQALDVVANPPSNFVEVWIAAGTYTPTLRSEPSDPRSASFTVPPTSGPSGYPFLRVIGGFSGTEKSIADRPLPLLATVLSGDLAGNDGPPSAGFANAGENAYHVVRVTPTSSALPFLTLVDLTVSGSNANGASSLGHDEGGGLWITRGFLDLVGCTIERCWAQNGSAARVSGPSETATGALILHHSVVRGNSTPAGAFAIDASGGAPALQFYSTAIIGNSGGVRAECPTCSPGLPVQLVAVGCTFSHNGTATGEPQVTAGNATSFLLAESIVWSPAADPVLRIVANANFSLFNVTIKGGLDAIDYPGGLVAPAPAENVQQFDPQFADPDGPDNSLGTPDDDFTPLPSSPVVDQVVTFATLNPPYFSYPRDARGGRRFADANGDGIYALDWGAFEYGGTGPRPVLYVSANLTTGADNGTSWADAYRGPAALDNALNSVGGGEYADVWLTQGDYLCNQPLDPLNPGVRPGRGFRVSRAARIVGGFLGGESSPTQRPPLGRSRISHAGNLPGPNAPGMFEVIGAGGTGESFYSGELLLDGLAFIDEDFSSGAGWIINVASYRSRFRNLTMTNCNSASQPLLWAFAPGGGAADLAWSEATDFRILDGIHGPVLLLATASSVQDVQLDRVRNSWPGPVISVNGTMRRVRVADFAVDVGVTSPAFLATCIEDSVFERVDHRAAPVLQAAVIRRSELTMSLSTSSPVNTSLAEQFVLRPDPLLPPGSVGNLDFQIGQCLNCTLLDVSRAYSAPPGGALPFFNSVVQFYQVGQFFPVLQSDFVNCVINSPPDPVFGATAINCRITTNPLLDPATARPLAGSPAIDAGCNALAPRDSTDIDLDGDLDEITPIDISGSIRVADDPQSPSAACPLSETPNFAGFGPIDAGAYEYAPQCPTCPGDRLWLDPAGGVFQDASNWIFGVPNATHPTAFSLPYQYTVLFNADAASRRLRIDRGDVTLNLAGRRYDLVDVGTASLVVDAPALVRGGTIVPSATLNVEGGGTLQGVYARVGDQPGNAGAVTVSGPGTRVSFGQQGMCLGCAGTGTLDVSGGATFVARTLSVGELPGAFGQVSVSGSGSRLVVPFFLTLDRGTLNIGAGARIETGFGLFALQGAHVTGSGQLIGDVVNFGLIEPTSASPASATLTVSGDFEQVGVNPKIGTQSGTLRLNASGSGNSITSDALVVTGTARLAGTLIVEPVGGFNPSPSAPPASLLSAGVTAGRFDLAVFPGLTDNKFMRLAYPAPFQRGGSVSVSIDTLASNIDLDPASSASVSGQPTDLALADFDTDGDADLALSVPDAANPTTAPGQVVILRNAGNTGPGGSWAGFTGGQVTVNVGVNPRGIAAGRFNADTAPDLIVANFNSNTATVLTNVNNGQAAMSVTQTIPVGANPVAVVTGVLRDASGGAIDAAVANRGSDSVTVLSNTAGTLAVASTLNAGAAPSDIALARLDAGAGSATLDIVVTNENDDTATVYYRPPGGTYPLSPSRVLPTSTRPVQVEPGGLDNPKELNDLAISNASSGSVSILLNNNLPDALAGFQPKADLPAGTDPGSITLGDLDSDSDPDLSVVSTVGGQEVVRVFRNDAQEVSPGVYQAAFAPFGDQYAGLDPRLVTSGDVNNDGREDLIAVNDLAVTLRPGGSGEAAGGAAHEAAGLSGVVTRGIVTQPNVAISLNAAPFVPPPCVGDFTNDRAVNTADLVFFLGAFGKPANPPGSGADLNADATVNTADLVIFLGVFGQVCP